MRRARFSIISFVRRHTVAGLIVKDLFRGFELWLVDEGLESSLPDEAVLATRLYTLEGFAMTAGVLVPLDIELIEYAIAAIVQQRPASPEALNALSGSVLLLPVFKPSLKFFRDPFVGVAALVLKPAISSKCPSGHVAATH